MPGRAPRADDADFLRMPLDEDGHQDALQNRLTDDEGAIRMNRIVQDERQWIGEDGRSLFERDPMLAEVRSGFARVPAEAHTIKCMTLNEPDHNSDGFPPAGGPWARRPTEAAVDEVNDSEEEAS